MSWADRLLRFAGRDTNRELVDHLRAIHQSSAVLGERLAACAGQAPNQNAEHDLALLVTAARALTESVAVALQQRGAPQPSAPGAVLNGAARNHWARLVSALDACREGRGHVLRHTPRLLELDPSLVDVLRQVSGGFDEQLDGLRALIARADPQAIN